MVLPAIGRLNMNKSKTVIATVVVTFCVILALVFLWGYLSTRVAVNPSTSQASNRGLGSGPVNWSNNTGRNSFFVDFFRNMFGGGNQASPRRM